MGTFCACKIPSVVRRLDSAAVPDVANVGQQHGEVSQAQRLLLGRQAQLGNGPDQSIDHRVEQTQQLVPALQLLGRLWRACTQICRTRHTDITFTAEEDLSI